MGRHGLPDELWGNTFIGKALHGTADLLSQRPTGDRMIILMTDGESSDINPPLDAAIIEHLRAEKITVFTIMLTGDKISEPLTNITRATGGEVRWAFVSGNTVLPAMIAKFHAAARAVTRGGGWPLCCGVRRTAQDKWFRSLRVRWAAQRTAKPCGRLQKSGQLTFLHCNRDNAHLSFTRWNPP